jgi:hypothetical protein
MTLLTGLMSISSPVTSSFNLCIPDVVFQLAEELLSAVESEALTKLPPLKCWHRRCVSAGNGARFAWSEARRRLKIGLSAATVVAFSCNFGANGLQGEGKRGSAMLIQLATSRLGL